MKERSIDSKIDDLAKVVSVLSKTVEVGFSDVRKEIRTVRRELSQEIGSVHSELGTEIQSVRDDLSKKIESVRSELSQEIQSVRTELGQEIDDLAQITARGFTEAHKDLLDTRAELKADIKFFRGDVDIMLDKHIGMFRKDYDELAVRVKDLECGALAR